MGIYDERIFPACFDLVMGGEHLARRRRALLARARGRVLEVGIGTGLNLPCYPESVRRIATVEPNPGMNKRLARRADKLGIELERHAIRGERLPFGDAEFDTAVVTWTLCSVRDPDAVVAEMHRVLRPGGSFLFIEHGLSPDEKVRRWQRRLNPLQRRIADGCRLDLDVRALLERSPFARFEVEAGYLERTPRFAGYTFQGSSER